MIACQGSENTVESHFVDVNKSSPMPNGGERIIDDIQLSRYACYLIVQNGDSRKEVIALGQTYFAVKTQPFIYLHINTNTAPKNRSGIADPNRYSGNGWH